METTNFIYYFLGMLTLFVGILIHPWVMGIWTIIKSWFTSKKSKQPNVYCDDLQSQIDELREQLDNVAANSYRRETNRKSNIRREVRDYLAELRTK